MNYIEYDWDSVQKYYDSGNFWKDVSKEFKISLKTIRKYKELGYLKERNEIEQKKLLKLKRKVYRHSDKIKNDLSIWRKNYIKKNKDKIKWVGDKSVPSEKFKNILKLNNIDFVEEFMPLENRYFRIDIAFPDKKIGIEINGEQHYERSGELKEYYQDRHDLIENNGWKLYEISHHLVFKETFINDFLIGLKNNFNLGGVDYSFYIKEKRNICECGNKKTPTAKLCFKCYKKTLSRKDVCKCGNNKRYSSNVCIICFRVNKEDKIVISEEEKDIPEKVCKCGNKKYKKSKECITCFNKKDRVKNRKVNRPDYKTLLNEIMDNGYLSTGRKYGVSDNTIRKWMKRYIKMMKSD